MKKRRFTVTKQPAIELKNITKTFGKVVANKNVSLTAYHGEILSILGTDKCVEIIADHIKNVLLK